MQQEQQELGLSTLVSRSAGRGDSKLISRTCPPEGAVFALEDSGWLLRGGLWVHYSCHDVYEVRICDPCLD